MNAKHAMEAAVQIHNLSVRVGARTLLSIPVLEVQKGERVVIIGPNGAGKSTLLRVLGGMTGTARIDSGSVCVLGRGIGPDDGAALSASAWRRLHAEVGQLMQGLHLVARLSARENVVLGALARPQAISLWRSWIRLYPKALQDEAGLALQDLDIHNHADTRADQLSGGERQKVILARLCLQKPHLILADEPTAALDPNATEQACQVLRSMAEKATLISVVHSLDLLPILADRVLGMAQGRLLFDLPIAELNSERLQQLYSKPVENGVH